MSDKVYNFGAGPAMLPEPVMAKIQKEWLNYQGMGVSVIEISHRSKEFVAILEEAQSLFRELTGLPENYKILFIHGGARMQFSALPLNLAGRKSGKRCLYFETGNFAKLASKDAKDFCHVEIAASSAETSSCRSVSVASLANRDAFIVVCVAWVPRLPTAVPNPQTLGQRQTRPPLRSAGAPCLPGRGVFARC